LVYGVVCLITGHCRASLLFVPLMCSGFVLIVRSVKAWAGRCSLFSLSILSLSRCVDAECQIETFALVDMYDDVKLSAAR
jgi:hypothetical protein